MIKKVVSILLLVTMCLSFSACGSKATESVNDNSTIDAAAVSKMIVPPCYALDEPDNNTTVWASNSMSADTTHVYYIGSDNEAEHVCRLDLKTAQDEIIFSTTDSMLFDVTTASDGVIYLLVVSNESEYSIIKMDSDGRNQVAYQLNEIEIKDNWVPKEIEYSGGALFILGDNYLVATTIDSKINLKWSLPVYPDSKITRTSDGKLVLSHSQNDLFAVQFYSAESSRTLQTVSFNMPFMDISGGESWDLLLCDNNALYGYQMETKDFKKLFSWNGIGILQGSIIETAGKLVCSGRIAHDKPSPLLVLQPLQINTANSSVIRFATTDPDGIDFRVQEAIREWNKLNPNCPIEIIDYSVYGSSDKTAAAIKLTADIVAGNMPDIYDFSMTSVDTIPSSAQFARRGLLEDLYPYIDNDPELSREDFIPGVMSSLEINGGLYEVVPAFSFVTTFAASSAVGSEENWTYDNYNSIVEKSDYFDSVFDKRHDRMWLLGNLLDASGKKLVNWTSCECYFESDYFRNLLEMAKKMPEKGEDMQSPSLPDDISLSPSLLYYVNANDVWMASTAPQVYKEDYCFPGLPEVGSAIYPLFSYGISAYSANKEQCWNFLRQFLTKEYNLKFFITPRIDGIREQINNTWEGFGEIRQYHPYGLEAMNKLADIMMSTDTVVRHDPQIWEIVYRESGAFFADQKGIEETMQAIQSRVSLYMAEQS